MRGDIKKYVQEYPQCQLCQKTGSKRLPETVEKPDEKGVIMGIDMITKLPKSRG